METESLKSETENPSFVIVQKIHQKKIPAMKQMNKYREITPSTV